MISVQVMQMISSENYQVKIHIIQEKNFCYRWLLKLLQCTMLTISSSIIYPCVHFVPCNEYKQNDLFLLNLSLGFTHTHTHMRARATKLLVLIEFIYASQKKVNLFCCSQGVQMFVLTVFFKISRSKAFWKTPI